MGGPASDPVSRDFSKEDVLNFLKNSARSAAIGSYQELFGWDLKDYEKACKFVQDLIEKHYPQSSKRFPKPNQHDGDGRLQIERIMHNEHPDLFNRRQNMEPSKRPAWYFDEIYLTGRGMEYSDEAVGQYGQTAGMLFQALAHGKAKKTDSALYKREEGLTTAAKLEHFGAYSPSREKRNRSSSAASSIGVNKNVKILRLGSTTPRYHSNFGHIEGKDVYMVDAPPHSLPDTLSMSVIRGICRATTLFALISDRRYSSP